MLAQEKALGLKLQEEIELRQFDLENKRNVLDSRIAACELNSQLRKPAISK